jgi:hypothetical protein
MTLLFRSPKIGGTANSLLTHDLFGASLGSHWLGGAGPLSAQGAVFAGLFLLLAVVGWLSARMTPRLGTPGLAGAAATAPGRPAQAARRDGTSADQASRISAGLARFIPYATVILAAFLPLAAGLYLLTTTAWTLGERTLLRRALGGGRAAAGGGRAAAEPTPGAGQKEPTPGAGSGEAADAAGQHRRPAGRPALPDRGRERNAAKALARGGPRRLLLPWVNVPFVRPDRGDRPGPGHVLVARRP